jgi:hypothetical protein
MDGTGPNGKKEHDRRLRTGMWMRYLIAGAALAVTRVALLEWLNDEGAATEMGYLLSWLYPEAVVPVLWPSLGSSYTVRTLYVALCSLVALDSFVLSTPILFVGWLRQRHVIVQIALCGLTIPVVSVLLVAIVRSFGLDE